MHSRDSNDRFIVRLPQKSRGKALGELKTQERVNRLQRLSRKEEPIDEFAEVLIGYSATKRPDVKEETKQDGDIQIKST